MMMMAGKNQAALAVCAQTKVIFPFNDTYNVIDRRFAIFSKLFKILVRNFQESEKNISGEF